MSGDANMGAIAIGQGNSIAFCFQETGSFAFLLVVTGHPARQYSSPASKRSDFLCLKHDVFQKHNGTSKSRKSRSHNPTHGTIRLDKLSPPNCNLRHHRASLPHPCSRINQGAPIPIRAEGPGVPNIAVHLGRALHASIDLVQTGFFDNARSCQRRPDVPSSPISNCSSFIPIAFPTPSLREGGADLGPELCLIRLHMRDQFRLHMSWAWAALLFGGCRRS